MSTTPISSSTTPSTYEPGMLIHLSLGGANYKVFAYFEEVDGTKTYLPSTIEAQTKEKIRGLAWGLLNAHDSRRQSLNEASYEIKTIDASGLIKTDNTIVSHDFNIAPIMSASFTDQMARSLSNAGHPIQASAMKAQDIWNTMEEMVCTATGRPRPLPPVHLDAVTTPPTILPPPPIVPSSSPLNPTTPAPPPNQPALQPFHYRPNLSVERDLQTTDFTQDNWYQLIPTRQKLRIINDIVSFRSPGGGIYEKVWNHFAAQSQPSQTLNRFRAEKDRLIAECTALESRIPTPIRNTASEIIDQSYQRSFSPQQLRQKMTRFIEQDFAGKEQLFQRLREQAIAEGVQIEEWDEQWAEHHALDDLPRFVQALAGWLDNSL